VLVEVNMPVYENGGVKGSGEASAPLSAQGMSPEALEAMLQRLIVSIPQQAAPSRGRSVRDVEDEESFDNDSLKALAEATGKVDDSADMSATLGDKVVVKADKNSTLDLLNNL
jgi:hypothetical protein